MTEIAGIRICECLWQQVSYTFLWILSRDRMEGYLLNYYSTKTVTNKNDRSAPFLFSLHKIPSTLSPIKDPRTHAHPSVEV